MMVSPLEMVFRSEPLLTNSGRACKESLLAPLLLKKPLLWRTKVALLVIALPYEASRFPPFQITVPSLMRVPRVRVLSAEPIRLQVMLAWSVSMAAMVPPLQLTVPTPETVFAPAIEPEAISKVLPAPMVLVPKLNVTVAPLTRAVPPPLNVRFPLKKNEP